MKKIRTKYVKSSKKKFKCECGCEVAKYKLKRHQTTKKHNDLMKAL